MKRWDWIGFLTLLWVALTSSFTLPNLILGFLLALVVVAVAIQEQPNQDRLQINILQIIPFFIFMLSEMLVANTQVIIDILRPKPQRNPGIIRFTPRCNKNYQRIWLANMISLIPGTLTIDTDKEANYLYIHIMFLHDKTAILEDFRRLESQVMRMLP